MTAALMTESISEHSQESVLRDMAHEIRQPLGAIESIAYYLSMVLSDSDGKHREQLTRIQQLVEQSNWILSNGLGLADGRAAEPETIDLEELITHVVAARPVSLDPPVVCAFATEPRLVRLDPGFGRALVENLLGLFRHLATETHPAEIRTWAGQNGVELEFSTCAPGYRSLASLPPGSGLSLDGARHIATLHGGSCTCAIDPASGIRVRVMLP
jgi:signal transduction histidine kinase